LRERGGADAADRDEAGQRQEQQSADQGVGTLARTVLRTRPTAARAVTRLSGAAMIAIAVLLPAERLTG
jgi:threonine/homoserine/homoserine lactone efflux protein